MIMNNKRKDTRAWPQVFKSYWYALSPAKLTDWDEAIADQLYGGPEPDEIAGALKEIAANQIEEGKDMPPNMTKVLGMIIKRRKRNKGTTEKWQDDVNEHEVARVCDLIRTDIREAVSLGDMTAAWNICCGWTIWVDGQPAARYGTDKLIDAGVPGGATVGYVAQMISYAENLGMDAEAVSASIGGE